MVEDLRSRLTCEETRDPAEGNHFWLSSFLLCEIFFVRKKRRGRINSNRHFGLDSGFKGLSKPRSPQTDRKTDIL